LALIGVEKRTIFPVLLFFTLSISLSLPPITALENLEDVLVAEFWTELDPMVGEGSSRPLSQEEAIRRCLEEARLVLSGMIYGYEVRYTPSDRSRQIEELIEIEPRESIPRGDPALRVMNTRMVDNRYYIRVRYNLKEYQIHRRQAWATNTYQSAGGRGNVSLQEGYRGKFRSFEEAIKNALRAYLQARERNKPREISAQVAYQEPPYTRIDAGGYHSKVRIKLKIKELQPYSAY